MPPKWIADLAGRALALLESRSELSSALDECEGALALAREQHAAEAQRLQSDLDGAFSALSLIAHPDNHYGNPAVALRNCPHCIASGALGATALGRDGSPDAPPRPEVGPDRLGRGGETT